MAGVAIEGGGISGDAYSGEGHWEDWLGLAKDVGSGVVTVSLSLLWHCSLLYYNFDSHFNCYHIIYQIQLQKSNALQVGSEWGTKGWEGDSGSGVKDVSVVAGRDEDVVVRDNLWPFPTNFYTSLITTPSSHTLHLQDFHESSGGNSGVFAVVSWQDSVQGLAVSRRDEVVSSEVWTNTWVLWLHLLLSLIHSILSSTPQELGNGNISDFMDGDVLNAQGSVLGAEVSTLTLLKLFVCSVIMSYHSLLTWFTPWLISLGWPHYQRQVKGIRLDQLPRFICRLNLRDDHDSFLLSVSKVRVHACYVELNVSSPLWSWLQDFEDCSQVSAFQPPLSQAEW